MARQTRRTAKPRGTGRPIVKAPPGANVEADDVSVTGDVVGRDKRAQTSRVPINLQMAVFAPPPDLQQLRGVYPLQ